MRKLALLAALAVTGLVACRHETPSAQPSAYFDSSGRDDVLSGGVKRIPVETPKGTFRVWTKRVGNNPRIKLLLLHGGPGATHEYFEAFDSYLPAAGIEYYFYDQLGSFYSDRPTRSRKAACGCQALRRSQAEGGREAEKRAEDAIHGTSPRFRNAEIDTAGLAGERLGCLRM